MNDNQEKSRERQSFPRERRVRKQAEFDRVYQQEAYAADAVLVVRGCANGLPYSRLGLAVSRKVGNAVLRNRWKRLIRQAFRTQQAELPGGYDFVARPRKGAEADHASIVRSLPRLAHQIAKRLKGASK